MPEDHPPPERLLQFLAGELDAAGRREVVRHLLTGCARCVAVTRPAWGPGGPPAALSGAEVLHPSSYQDVFDRLLASSCSSSWMTRPSRGPEPTPLWAGRLAPTEPAPDPALVEPALVQPHAGELAAKHGSEVAAAILELALFHAGAGRWERVATLLDEGLSALPRCRELTPGALLSLLVLRRAVETRTATLGLLRELAGYLARCRRPLASQAAPGPESGAHSR